MKLFLLPTRELVFHPDTINPMYLENMISVRAVDSAIAFEENKPNQIVLVPQKNWSYPTGAKDLYDIGTIANVMQILRLPDNTVQVMMQTTKPVSLSNIQIKDGVFTADCEQMEQIDDSSSDLVLGLRDAIMDALNDMSKARKIDMQKLKNAVNLYPMNAFISAIITAIELETADAVEILVKKTFFEKLTILLEKIQVQVQLVGIEQDISRRVNNALANGQREMFLRERLAAIQKELGESDSGDESSARSIKEKIEKSAMPDAIKTKAMDELKRLRNQMANSAESAAIRTYLDELISMPWGEPSKQEIDLDAARKILDTDHYGMTAVKERVLEHLAVMKKTNSSKGVILCLVGAPGVGKTSFGQSIARALNRPFQRISLGGVSDEAHFRGHRRTYVGSQPGRIMDAVKRAGMNNPVILLDEIDKLGDRFHGNPEAALLEILDPEQNKKFRDHYLEVDFDLSNVMFIATANSLTMSPALLDRMEIIELPNYTLDEKVGIAKHNLLSKAAEATGWDATKITIDDETIKHVINKYTNEAGVRNLRRELTAMMRRAMYKTNCQADSYTFNIDAVDNLLVNIRPEIGRKIGFQTINRPIHI
jgi:ATP-dependent Lon protease